ncbi:hypothetical protein IV203_003074 [Nitzschia inconspicua]|uniref:Uncharacterized protein n=1 Tax=Nitzschia inconspicua TaxID=303405 RepID=A0A9K3L182_9STRA|nr:hypothetical protein IV203_003074 [Nitzschia inconspicua]
MNGVSRCSLLLVLRPLVVASFLLPACCHHKGKSRLWLGRPDAFVAEPNYNSTSPNVLSDHDSIDITVTPSTFCRALHFQSSFSALSDPLPDHVPTQSLTSFFDDPSRFSFGPSIPSTLIPLTPELRQEWTEACQRVGATLPDHDGKTTQPQHHFQRVVSVRAAGFSMLGLTVEWSALMGAQVLVPENELPCIEFVLIKDNSEARGSNKLFLWMYNKIMGSSSSSNNNNNNGNRKRSNMPQRETTFSSRFGFVEQQNQLQKKGLAFQCTGSMEMLFPVPSIVGRVLGSSSSKKMKNLQQKVNNIITSEIEKDMRKAILHWENNFKRWSTTTTEQ